MTTKFLEAFFKPLVSFIGWIGGAVAGIAVILSAIGFLVMRGHQDLLGIAGVVPMPADTWSVEGARFVYNSLFFFFGGLLSSGWVMLVVMAWIGLLVFVTKEQRFIKIQERTKTPAGKSLLLSVSFVLLLLLTNLFAQYGEPSHLLVEEQTYDDEIALRASMQGIQQLRARYALLVAVLAVGFIWLQQLPRALNIRFIKVPPLLTAIDSASSGSSQSEPKAEETVRLEKFSSCHIIVLGLWLFFLIPLLSLPINYGKMAKENRFLKVRLLRTLDETQQQGTTPETGTITAHEGWLLYEDAEKVVLYKEALTQEPIHIFTRKDFAHIEILAYNNIFAVK